MAAVQEIDGRYRVLKTLGEGLTGEVFLVESEAGRSALKLLKPFADRDLETDLVGAFKFEFAFLKDLLHPNVVRIQDFGFDPKLRRFYFTEEFLEGKSLPDFAKGLSPAEIGKLFLQAIQGLQAIHRARLLHGDIKGNNLWVISTDEGPCLKIIDLGLADPRFSVSGGTPSTMAPEKILKEPADQRSDLYSLGVVFYQLFSGKNPFARKTLRDTYEAHLTHRPEKLSLVNPKVPAYWNEIFETLLAKNPAHRYRNAAELLAAIDFAEPKQRATKGRPWRLDRWMGRKSLVSDLTEKVRKALRSKGARQAFLLTGEAGVGKSRLAQELKYLFQMEKVRVASPPETPCDFWVFEGESVNPGEVPWLKSKAGPAVLLLTTGPESREAWERTLQAAGWKPQVFPVPLLSKGELEAFLKELSGLESIPENFLKRLWENTRGNPQLVASLLEHLAQQQNLVDGQGRWNLSMFREADFDLKSLDLDLSELDAALTSLPPSEAPARAELWMRRAEELLKNNQNAAAGESLARAEAEAQSIPELGAKLTLRAAIYERQGLREIREQHFEEARARFERALALLEEANARSGSRWLRVQNYLAWLLCQEGKVDAAIALFSEAQAQWKRLDPEQQAQVRNQDLGYAYLLKGDAVRAITELLVMLPFFEKIGDANLLMKVHYNLGEAYLLARDYPAAIESFTRGVELMRLHRHFEFLLRAYNGLGKARHLQGEWEAALHDYGRGLDLARYLEDFASAAALAQNIGSIQAERGAFAPARENFELALKLLKKLPTKNAHAKYLQARALVELGDLLRREGKFSEAEAQARDADRMASQEEGLAGFRFWTLLTRAEIARDEANQVRLQDLLAELLPLADDEEKKARCAQLRSAAAAEALDAQEAPPAGHETRVEAIDPEASLLLAQRRVAEERDPETLRRLVRELQERLDRTQQELTLAREQAVESSVLGRFAEQDFLSRNPAMQELFRTVERVRDTELSVVLHGESGTGKELLARSLHEKSRRHQGPFVAVNCAALPAALIEAELFGYRAGAFTGANRDKAGLIESAQGGTLFLDEIAELDLALQAKLLRVLQEKELTRLGETRPRAVKFRLLSASHRQLREQVEAGKFREDLYFRVAELELNLPPLRERREDIALLSELFIRNYLKEHGESAKVGLGRDLHKAMLDYDWPGNVRELENLIRVATALRRGPSLRLEDLPDSWRQRLQTKGRKSEAKPKAEPAKAATPLAPDLPIQSGQSWREAETLILAKALGACEFDVPRAAASLHCAPSKLYQRLREDRIAERKTEWEALPWIYREGERLSDLKRRCFVAALAEAGGSVYRAARTLGVSPGMVYKWQ